MQELFDRLLAEGEAGIDRLVAERTQETVTLDFKKKVDASTGKPDDQDKRVVAKAMSAFANSAGGLIVYGVHGVPGSDGVDCAQAARPIAEIERFVSALHELTGELLQPRHSGIQVGMIRSERSEGAGYAVVNVERSERRPHRSEAKDQKQYFKRGGSKSYAMEHYDIEDAFRRQSSPSLDFILVRSGHMQSGLEIQADLQILARNTSGSTAKYAYLHISEFSNCSLSSTSPDGFIRTGLQKWRVSSATSDTVIHPGLEVWISGIVIKYRINNLYQAYKEDIDRGFSFRYRLGCENSQMIEGLYRGVMSDFIK